MKREVILVVENDSQIRQELCGVLARVYDCLEKENGVDGLAYLEKNPGIVDLVITDLEMPLMDGFEMLQCIQSNSLLKNTPILLLTSLDKKDDIKNAFELGVDDILTLPLEPNVVLRRVKNMLLLGDSRIFHNVMEDHVRVTIDENIDNLGICTCPICRKDLMTLTLNRVTAKYVTSEKGAILSKVSMTPEDKIKLLAEVAHSAQQIKEKPRHALSDINQ